VIQKGGSDSEGTHQLIRDGGPSQTVYLVSSVVDMDQFVGKKVKVWGQNNGCSKSCLAHGCWENRAFIEMIRFDNVTKNYSGHNSALSDITVE